MTTSRFVALFLLFGCGSRTPISASNQSDAGADAWSCGNPNASIAIGVWCGGVEQQRACARWAQTLTRTGVAHATCRIGSAGCVWGDTCVSPEQCGVCNVETMERCAYASALGPGEVCVSDTPDGAPHCVEACQ